MRPEQWTAFKRAAKREPGARTPLMLIVDSPWIPGYAGVGHLDYFLDPEQWSRANLKVLQDFLTSFGRSVTPPPLKRYYTRSMTRKLFLLLTITALFAGAALAADVTGKWTAQVPGRDGQMREVTLDLKADGATLTGTVSGAQGQANPITEGKVSGAEISFVVTVERGGNTMKQTYTGTLAGDELKMKRQGQRGQPVEFTAKRAK